MNHIDLWSYTFDYKSSFTKITSHNRVWCRACSKKNRLHLVTWFFWDPPLCQTSQRHKSFVLTQTAFVLWEVTPKDSSDNNKPGLNKHLYSDLTLKVQFGWH